MPNLARLENALTHPAGLVLSTFTAFTATALGLAQAGLLVQVWAWFVGNSPALFTASSIIGFTIAPNVPWLPAGPLIGVAILTGAVFAGWKLWGAFQNLRKRI